jgi:hypothetical protein
VIEQLFDEIGTVYYRVTFPDGNQAFCGACWMADIFLQRWNDEKYAVNYRGANLKAG